MNYKDVFHSFVQPAFQTLPKYLTKISSEPLASAILPEGFKN